jgi:alpha-beta hydrolase superfamily lysophospholipase
MTATPIWLGPEDRPLSGWMHFPEDGRAAGGVVICPALGIEAVYAYWTLRKLADQLAAAGLVALRFDYDGTGDSVGNWDDPDRVAGWLGSIATAIDHVRELGLGRVAVVGLRMGGTLAAATLTREGMADDLVLWDPCASGKSFLREQKALWAFLRSQAVEWGILDEDASWGLSKDTAAIEAGSVETPGLVFDGETVAALETISIEATREPLAKRVLLLARDNRKPNSRMVERLATSPLETFEIAGQEDLLTVRAVTPQATLERIVGWLSEPRGPTVAVGPPAMGTAVVARTQDGHAVLERPVEMGPAGLFGMMTEPERGVPLSAPTVLFLNAGRINHVGPGRLWVEMSRRLSGQGFRCLRFDLSGIGDSPTRPGRSDQVEYPPDALLDVAEARQAIGIDEVNVVLIGVCSGGYHAIESALEKRVEAICAVNPILTFFDPGGSSERNFERDGFSAGQARSSIRSWTRSISGLGMVRRITRHFPEGAWWIVNRIVVKAIPTRTLKRLTDLDMNVIIVAGAPEARDLQRGEHRTIRALTESGRFRMDTIPYLEHSLLERTGREHVAEVPSTYLVKRFGADCPERTSARGSVPL